MFSSSIRKFISRFVSSAINFPRNMFLHGWRCTLLDISTSDSLFKSEPSVKLLQSSIANIIAISISFETALASMLNNFSAPRNTPDDAISCLRATLQILIIYSITTGDCSWLEGPDASKVEEATNALKTLLSSMAALPKPISVYEPNSMDKCCYHALLHDIQGQMEQQRASIVRLVHKIVSRLPLWKPFEQYIPRNRIHISNAVSVVSKLTPKHRLISEAFALVMNPVPSDAYNTRTQPNEKQSLLENVE